MSSTLPAKSRSANKRIQRSDSLAVRTVLTAARQRNGFDGQRCEMLFRYLDTADVLRSALLRPLNANGLTELQFLILMALYALEPEPASPADLAVYTAVSRAAVTEALAKLEKNQFVTRTRDEQDLRVFHLRLTESGRALADKTLVEYLQVATQLPQQLGADDHESLLATLGRLAQGAEQPVPATA